MSKAFFSRLMASALALPVLLSTQAAVAQDGAEPLELKSNQYFQVDQVTTESGLELTRTIISGPPTPPPGFESQRASIDPGVYGATNTLEVPAFSWSFGCSATSAAMIAGYYDRMGWENMYTGPTNGGVMPLDNSSWGTMTDSIGETRDQCPLSATRNGVDGRSENGHVDDYWYGYGSAGPDPWDGNWPEHTKGDCTADFMNTNQWVYPAGGWNVDASTVFYTYTSSADKLQCDILEADGHPANKAGDVGFRDFFESRGYNVSTCYTQKTNNAVAGGFSFADYKEQIDAGHPVMFHVTGHTMVGVGYDDTGNTMYIHDTWDYSMHSMPWGGSYYDMTMYAVSIVHVDEPAIVVEGLDRFLSYKAKTTSKTPKFESLTAALNDQFEAKGFDVKKMESLLNPAAADHEGIEDTETHLVGYQIKKARGEDKHEKQTGLLINNELGTLVVDTKKSDSLFVPSAKGLDGPVEPLDPVSTDHFKCYSVVVKKKVCEDDPTMKCKTDSDCHTGSCTQGFPKGVQRAFVDQFEQDKLFDIKKPTKLCVPVDVDDGGIIDEDISLMCYQAKNAKGEPKHVKVQGIYVNNQFAVDQLEPDQNWMVDTVKEEEICIPSLVGPIDR